MQSHIIERFGELSDVLNVVVANDFAVARLLAMTCKTLNIYQPIAKPFNMKWKCMLNPRCNHRRCGSLLRVKEMIRQFDRNCKIDRDIRRLILAHMAKNKHNEYKHKRYQRLNDYSTILDVDDSDIVELCVEMPKFYWWCLHIGLFGNLDIFFVEDIMDVRIMPYDGSEIDGIVHELIKRYTNWSVDDKRVYEFVHMLALPFHMYVSNPEYLQHDLFHSGINYWFDEKASEIYESGLVNYLDDGQLKMLEYELSRA